MTTLGKKKNGGVKEFFRKKIVTLKRKPQMIPMLVLYLIFQRQFIEGIALTGTKA